MSASGEIRYRSDPATKADMDRWALGVGHVLVTPPDAACCHLHQAEGCCDPDDCGPCCENCPTCPSLRREGGDHG